MLRGLPAADIAFGQVVSTSGDPASGAIVYAQLPNAIIQAALVRNSGSFVIPLALARQKDLKSYVSYNRKTSELKIWVSGSQLGKTMLVTTTEKDSPVPVLTLAETPEMAPDESPVIAIDEPKEGEAWNNKLLGRGPKDGEVKVSLDGQAAFSAAVGSDGKFETTFPGLTQGGHTVSAVTIVAGKAYLVVRSFSRP
jgi:hypothetical protein